MTKRTVFAGGSILAIGIATGVLLRAATAAGPAALLRRQSPRPADQSGRRRRVRADVAERQGLRRHLLGRELLVRSRPRRHRRAEPRRAAERADQQRLGVVHQPRRLGPHRALDRRPEPRRPARQPDAAARAERAARQRHRQRHALRRRSRRRHDARPIRRVAVIRRFNMQTGAPAGEIRVEQIDRLQRHRGRRRRHDLRDADGRRRPDARSDDLAGVEDHAATAPRRSSSRARRCVSRTASPSIRRATSSSSTSATTKC